MATALLDKDGKLLAISIQGDGGRVLDDHGIDVTSDALPGPEVPDDCDLIPGKYRWDAEANCFQPIMSEFAHGRHFDDLVAIKLALLAIRNGKPFSEYTNAWLAEFEGTIDAKAAPMPMPVKKVE